MCEVKRVQAADLAAAPAAGPATLQTAGIIDKVRGRRASIRGRVVSETTHLSILNYGPDNRVWRVQYNPAEHVLNPQIRNRLYVRARYVGCRS